MIFPQGKELDELLQHLTHHQQVAITMYYGLDHGGPLPVRKYTLKEIGLMMGRSGECARYHRDKGLAKLKRLMKEDE